MHCVVDVWCEILFSRKGAERRTALMVPWCEIFFAHKGTKARLV